MTTETPAEIVLKSDEDVASMVINILATIPKTLKTQDEYVTYTKELAIAKLKLKQAEAFFLDQRRPFLEALEKHRDKEKQMLRPLKEKYATLNVVTTNFFVTQEAERKRRQDNENKRNEQKVEEAIAKGKDPDSVKPAKVIESKAPAKVEVGGGVGITMKLDKHFKITASGVTSRHLIDDKRLAVYRSQDGVRGIPDQAWCLDHTRLLGLMKNGTTVPGVELIELLGNRLS